MKKLLFLLILSSGFCTPVFGQAMISIFAGGGSSIGDGGPATAARVNGVQGICTDTAGNVYFLETSGRVRKVTPAGVITTVAGHGATGFSGDGGPATAATFSAYGLGCDIAGNLFIGDWDNNRVRRVDAATGIITTVAGNGSGSTSGDGGPATAAGISRPIGATADLAGNIYISEYGNERIRRVDAASGIITTISGTVGVITSPCQICTDFASNVYVADQDGAVWKINTTGHVGKIAGGGSSHTASGIPATSAGLSGPEGVAIDCDGNIFIADNDDGIVRKVDASGIITTIGGSGSSTVTYAGIPATSASFANQWIAVDRAGNVYVTNGGSPVYKITGSSTGGGSGYSSLPSRTICVGDTTSFGYWGGIWTSADTAVASIDSSTGRTVGLSAGTAAISCTTPACGTLVSTATVNAYCTGTPSPGTAFAVTADTCGNPDTVNLTGSSTNCGITHQWQLSYDGSTWTNISGANGLYYAHYHIYSPIYYRCAVTCSGSGITAYSNSVYVLPPSGVGLHSVTCSRDTACRGASFAVSACSVASSYYSITTWYGDGSNDNHVLDTTSGLPHLTILHNYANSGTYSIKQVLYDGTLPVDSTSYSYEYIYCSTLPLKFYVDVNNDCVFDSSDYYLSIPVKVEVDSNGVVIDTLSATAGLYYKANGGPGTIYTFKFLHDTSWITCPSTGIVYDTIVSYVNFYPVNYLAVKATSVPFDLALKAVVPVTGINDQWGNIYIQNNEGTPTSAIVTLTFDSRRYLTTESNPMGTVSGNTATWYISSVSPTDRRPVDIYYVLRDVSASLPVGAIEQGGFTVSPESGDCDTSNNTVDRGDTVKAGCDPNYIECAPAGCFPLTTGTTQLQYTIHFENTGNDTAHNIYVLDTLPANVNQHSLTVKLASSNMNIAMINDGGFHIVKFDFPNINLLDSAFPGYCDGAVIFTVNTLPGLALGTSVGNRAGVYFDINPVVMTNSAVDVVGCPDTISAVTNIHTGKFEMFPNPVTDELNVITDHKTYNSFTISNTIGVKMMQRPINNDHNIITVSSLPAGIYYLLLSGENGSKKVEKFVKM